MSTELKRCLICGCLSCEPTQLIDNYLIAKTGLRIQFFIDGTKCTKCEHIFRNKESHDTLNTTLDLLRNHFGQEKVLWD